MKKATILAVFFLFDILAANAQSLTIINNNVYCDAGIIVLAHAPGGNCGSLGSGVAPGGGVFYVCAGGTSMTISSISALDAPSSTYDCYSTNVYWLGGATPSSGTFDAVDVSFGSSPGQHGLVGPSGGCLNSVRSSISLVDCTMTPGNTVQWISGSGADTVVIN